MDRLRARIEVCTNDVPALVVSVVDGAGEEAVAVWLASQGFLAACWASLDEGDGPEPGEREHHEAEHEGCVPELAVTDAGAVVERLRFLTREKHFYTYGTRPLPDAEVLELVRGFAVETLDEADAAAARSLAELAAGPFARWTWWTVAPGSLPGCGFFFGGFLDGVLVGRRGDFVVALVSGGTD